MIVDPIAIIPAIYELCIFSLAIILTTLVFIRYREKKNDLSRMLFLCNLAFTLAILCSIFGKLVTIFYGTDLSLLDPFPREILGRTRASRFSFGFVGIAGLYAILFRYWVFDKSPNKKIMKGEIAYGIFAILFTIFVFDLNNAIYTIVSFTLIIILMIMSLRLIKRAKPVIKSC